MSRELTFTGFLRRYLYQLSGCETTCLEKLAEAATHNMRLIEPLVLYAIFADKVHVLRRAEEKYFMLPSCVEILHSYTKQEMKEALRSHSEDLPKEFHKVWHSYMVAKNRSRADDHTKELMRKKILYLQKLHRISNYRIYTDLQLNSGNITAWLKHGRFEQVSLSTARQVLSYIENACNQNANSQASNNKE